MNEITIVYFCLYQPVTLQENLGWMDGEMKEGGKRKREQEEVDQCEEL